MTQQIHIRVPDGRSRTRLEDYLFDYFPNLSRMYLRDVVRDGLCEVNGRHENVGFRIRGGDFIEIEVDVSRETSMRPEDVDLDIIFEDSHMIVVNKPVEMLVHPTHREKSGTLLNALAFHLNYSNAERENAEIVPGSSGDEVLAFRVPPSAFVRPGLVHRLDKRTSGLMVVAKSTRVHRALARQFQKKLVKKTYLALVEGIVAADSRSIDEAIGRYADEKRWDVKHDGKSALSNLRVVERYHDATLVELEPVTGRTNQLRIHCASIGHPIVGDVPRGGRPFGRLCLHAWRVSFRHPITNEPLEFERRIDFYPEATKKASRVT